MSILASSFDASLVDIRKVSTPEKTHTVIVQYSILNGNQTKVTVFVESVIRKRKMIRGSKVDKTLNSVPLLSGLTQCWQ